ncbi:unnamed protein product [Moneuplotes crassus]|uniref:Uncharacterized protein n=1 Tax=Euplotes crassus TaxID=5936 RepID=A0AAD1U242_EUPCR|nr:unnamed protein product [Moneuplotes crassus]
MERISYTQELVTKFSHCSTILQYYGTFTEAMRVIPFLCKGSLAMVRVYYEALKNRLNTKKSILRQKGSFTKELVKFLLESKRYLCYQMEIKLEKPKEVTLFKKFISKIEKPENAQFRLINVMFTESVVDVEMYNSIYWRLVNLNIDPSGLQFNFPEYLSYGLKTKKKGVKFEYTKKIYHDHIPTYCSLFKRIHSAQLDICYQNLQNLLRLSIPISELKLAIKIIQEGKPKLLDFENIHIYPNNILEEEEDLFFENLRKSCSHVTKVILLPIIEGVEDPSSLNWYTLEDVQEVFPNVKDIEYDFKYLPWSVLIKSKTFNTSKWVKYYPPPSLFCSSLLQNACSYSSINSVLKNGYFVIKDVDFFLYNPATEEYSSFHCTKYFQAINIKTYDSESMEIEKFKKEKAQIISLSSWPNIRFTEVKYLEGTKFEHVSKVNTLNCQQFEQAREEFTEEHKEYTESNEPIMFFKEKTFDKVVGLDFLMKYQPRTCREVCIKLENDSNLSENVENLKILSSIRVVSKLSLEVELTPENCELIIKALNHKIPYITIIVSKLTLKKIPKDIRQKLVTCLVCHKSLRNLSFKFKESNEIQKYHKSNSDEGKLKFKKFLTKMLLTFSHYVEKISLWKEVELIDY